jgi:hypothetical protein
MEDLLAGFFARDFLARFVVVVHPTTIVQSSITRLANTYAARSVCHACFVSICAG